MALIGGASQSQQQCFMGTGMQLVKGEKGFAHGDGQALCPLPLLSELWKLVTLKTGTQDRCP